MELALLIILIIVAVILITWVILLGVSHLHYGRSLMATLAEGVVRLMKTKKRINSPKRVTKFLERAKKANLAPYKIPKSVKFHVSVEERQEHGMQVYYLNGESESNTLIFYFHGGAYISNPLTLHWKLCDKLAKQTGASVIVPIYPKLPNCNCNDAYKAVMALYKNQATKDKRIIFVGDSSGGGLALGLAQKLRNEGGIQPQRLVLLSPWLDVSMDNEDTEKQAQGDPMHGTYFLRILGKLWAGEQSVFDFSVSPIYGELTGLGRISLFTGTREIVYPEVLRLDALLNDKAIEHDLFIGKGLNHVYPLYPIPEGKKATQTILKLVQSELGEQVSINYEGTD